MERMRSLAVACGAVWILAAAPVREHFTEPPGTVVDHLGHIACGGDTGLRLVTVQPDSARAMDAIAAINGNYMAVDRVLGFN